MEYAAGGELFDRICQAGRFSEPEARYFFQQLISGVHYCHNMVLTLFFISFLILVLCIKFVIVFHYIYIQQICHRDLKLENTLLDGSPAPRLKICDFGYSKVLRFYIIFSAYISLYILITIEVQSSVLHSRPKSTVGTPAYIAPEVLSRREYDGKVFL